MGSKIANLRLMRDDRGQVTAFVTILMLALWLFAGIVLDGGELLTARVRAMDEAQAAARAGADAINAIAYRQGATVTLNPGAAITAAQSYLAVTGDVGTVSVAGDTVTVTVHRTQRMQIFDLVGLHAETVSATATATPIRGISSGGQ